jgi:Ca2+-binding RTX toxin-like protein
MAWHFPQSGTAVVTPTHGDGVFVAQQVFLHGGILAFNTYGHEIIVAGTVANESNPIEIGFYTGGANSVTVEATGQVRSFGSTAILLYGAGQQVINHGLITGNHGVRFYDELGSAANSSTLVNSGIIDAEGYGIWHRLSAVTLTVHNSGTIRGVDASFFSDGTPKDEITNAGKMVGDIVLGGGDDLYDGRLGTVDGEVFGQAGIDRLYSGTGNNRLFGGDGNDTLMGGAGVDYLSGGTGIDRAAYTSAKAGVTVSLANAALNTGDAKGDTFNSIENLTGSDFSDNLFGTNARNVISGGAGNDTIKGYRGNDTLAGGTGKDIFVFNSALNASTNVDIITDFRVVDDTIQLDNAYFTGLTTLGTLAAGAFRANTTGWRKIRPTASSTRRIRASSITMLPAVRRAVACCCKA